jgi:hypothetical protein
MGLRFLLLINKDRALQLRFPENGAVWLKEKD